MGYFTSGTKLWKPEFADQGWDDEVNTNFDRLSEPHINVKSYGATGDGTTDDFTAIQNAINQAVADDGGILFFPPGRYLVSAPLTVGSAGVRSTGISILGAGSHATQIETTTDFATDPVILYMNPRWCHVERLSIHGNSFTPCRAAIEFRRDEPGAGPAISQNVVRDVVMGAVQAFDGTMLVDGIRFTDVSGTEGNNDFNHIENVRIEGFSGVAINFESRQSLGNLILGGNISYGPTAVQVHGGGFRMIGTSLDVITGYEFDFQAPSSGAYGQASTITGVIVEDENVTDLGILRTTSDPGISVIFTNYTRFGSKPNVTLIDYGSDGDFVMANSRLELGQVGQAAVFGDGSTARFSNCHLGIHTFTYAGRLVMNGNHHITGSVSYIPSGASSRFDAHGEYCASIEMPTDMRRQTSTTPVLQTGDPDATYPRFLIDAAGTHSWGSGSGVTDTAIYRGDPKHVVIGADNIFKSGQSDHASLPNPATVSTGGQFYCTTHTQPIWSNSAWWVEADGTAH